VTIQEYIQSGMIEYNVLGFANETEQAEFERICEQHPECRAAKESFERALEKIAVQHAVHPPTYLKSKIFSQLEIESEKSKPHPILTDPLGHISKTTISDETLKYLLAASIFLLAASIIFNVYLLTANRNLNRQYNRVLHNTENETLEESSERPLKRRQSSLFSSGESNDKVFQAPGSETGYNLIII